MRNRFVRLAGTTALLASMVALTGAQTRIPGSGWYSTVSMQNPGDTTASVNLTVLPQQGVAGSNSTASFALSGGQKTFFPGSGGTGGAVDVSPALAAGFVGSLVINSNQPLVAIGTITNLPVPSYGVGTTGGWASGQFRASSASSSSLFFPTVKNNYVSKTSSFSIQAGAANVTYTATVRTNDGATHTKTGSISAGRSVVLDPGQFSPVIASTNCGSLATSPCFGTFNLVASGGTVTGSYVEFNNTQSPSRVAQAATLFSATDASSSISCPLFKSEYAGNKRSTAVSIYNAGSSSATANAVFKVSAGPNVNQIYTQQNISIAAGKSVTLLNSSGNIGGMPAGNLASVSITALSTSAQLVAVANETNLLDPTNLQKSAMYTCFDPSKGTQSMAAPVVKKNYNNVTSGVTIQNVDTSSDAPVDVVGYYQCGGSLYSVTGPNAIGPGESVTFYNPTGIPDGSICAVVYDGGIFSSLIGVVNEGATTELDNKTYEAININTTTCPGGGCNLLTTPIMK